MQKDGRVSPMVLINDWTALTPQFESCDGIPVVRWRVMEPPNGLAFKERLKYNLWLKFFGYHFRKFCRNHRVIAINLHFPGRMALSIANTIHGMKKSPPIILSYHGSDVRAIETWNEKSKTAWHELSKHVAMNIACSKNVASELLKKMRDITAIQTIYNGIDSASFNSILESETRASHEKKEKLLLNIGNFEPVKGQDILLRAFAQLSIKQSNVRLIIVGRDKGFLSTLRSMANELAISEKVSFIEDVPHEEIAKFYRMADVFILPSRSEGFPLVILEAAAFGLPAVSARVGGVPELIDDPSLGYLVESEDPSSLEQAISDVLKDSLKARQVGRRLQTRVTSLFTWEAACSQYLALIGIE